MFPKKFFWPMWRKKTYKYYPCPGFCHDPDQRRFRFDRWCNLGFKISAGRGGSTMLYRLYWRTHPEKYQKMLQNLNENWTNKNLSKK